MIRIRPTIDDILSGFFSREREAKKGTTLQRIDAVERLLRDWLETDGERFLRRDDATLLARERDFDADGAFARTMHADDLIFALPEFVTSAAELGPLDRRVQLRMVDRLIGSVLAAGLVSREEVGMPLRDARVAIDWGRAQLRHPSLREV